MESVPPNVLNMISEYERKKNEQKLIDKEKSERNKNQLKVSSAYVKTLNSFKEKKISVEELLHETEKAFGLRFPIQGICPNHTGPGQFFIDCLSSPGFNCIIWANRGGGKTQVGSAISAIESIVYPGCETRLLGGSEDQSERFYEHITEYFRRGDMYSCLDGDPLKTRVSFKGGGKTEILAASEKSVRGPHVPRYYLDEVDLFDPKIYDNVKYGLTSKVGLTACMRIFSTMNEPGGLMSQIIDDAADHNHRVYSWCIWDVIERCEGRDCLSCILYEDCEGKARYADGFFKIDDVINIRTSPGFDQDTWESQMLCKRPGQKSLIWPQYDEQFHLWRSNESAEEVRRRMVRVVAGVDWGWETPSAILVLGKDSDGILWTLEEVYKTHMLPEDLGKFAGQLKVKWGVERFFCDRTRPENIDIWRKKLKLPVAKGLNDVEKRVKLVASRLMILPPAKKPRLLIGANCKELRREMKGYRRRGESMRGTRGDKAKEDIIERDDHVCLVAGTKILVEGIGRDPIEVEIENIAKGSYCVVTPQGSYGIEEAAYTGIHEIMTIMTDKGKTLTGTKNHPIYAKKRGWTALEELHWGEEIMCIDILTNFFAPPSLKNSWEKVTTIAYTGEHKPVYNLKVQQINRYFANKILVHNCDSLCYAVAAFDTAGGWGGY